MVPSSGGGRWGGGAGPGANDKGVMIRTYMTDFYLFIHYCKLQIKSGRTPESHRCLDVDKGQ